MTPIYLTTLKIFGLHVKGNVVVQRSVQKRVQKWSHTKYRRNWNIVRESCSFPSYWIIRTHAQIELSRTIFQKLLQSTTCLLLSSYHSFKIVFGYFQFKRIYFAHAIPWYFVDLYTIDFHLFINIFLQRNNFSIQKSRYRKIKKNASHMKFLLNRKLFYCRTSSYNGNRERENSFRKLNETKRNAKLRLNWH